MKKIKIVLLVFIMFISFGIFPIVKADSKGYITGDDVLFRSGAGTGFVVLDSLNVGDEVIFNSMNKVKGPGCDDGWYSLTYNNKKGYVCSSYVSVTIDLGLVLKKLSLGERNLLVMVILMLDNLQVI